MHKTIVVVDNNDNLPDDIDLDVVTFEQYLADYPKLHEPKTRIINLCDTEHYLSRGYYCSLLAEARQHKVLPSVVTINDLRDFSSNILSGTAFSLPFSLIDSNTGKICLLVLFGWVEQENWQKLARQVFEKYPSPILKLNLLYDKNGIQLEITRLSLSQLDNQQRTLLFSRLQEFTRRVWKRPPKERRMRWDMAILVDPEEKQPPSNKAAIRRFIKAAAKMGINAEIITALQSSQIAQYDALFIRETTAIDHHTYRLARMAEREGLVVMDDPTSILRCCNKVFLHDAFTYNSVPSLKTQVVIDVSEKSLNHIEQEFDYPVVVKMPEGSFSRGVFKINNRQELKEKLENLFRETALLLVQQYLYTDFDWRIGVLNGRAIYACRYYMARNHWQIYNHDSKRYGSGGFETLPTFETPRIVLDAALKAANMIGDGLYGVDLKEEDKQVYVVEVNDNPSIDYKIEDVYLGNELYMQIMSEFGRRLEQRGRQ